MPHRSARYPAATAAVGLVLALPVVGSVGLVSAQPDADRTGVAATTTSSAGVRARPPLLLPNARALAANRLYIADGSGGERVLRFESGLANTGRGVLEVRPNQAGNCRRGQQHASQILFRDKDRNGWFNRSVDTRRVRRDAGCMVFHPSHDHWHFEAAARYALWDPDRKRKPVIVKSRKMSFCLRDTEPVPDRWATRDYPQHYGDCHQRSPQGISIGWVDVYGNYLPGQSLRLPNALKDDVYCLRTTVDPKDQLRERNDKDNHSLRAVRIWGDRVAIKPTRRCRAIG